MIQRRIAAERPITAERFVLRLREAGNRLSDFPEAGRPDGASRVVVTVSPYIIRYRVRPEGVLILSIRHGARRA
jgi:plasmid stabilization system protein ParE